MRRLIIPTGLLLCVASVGIVLRAAPVPPSSAGHRIADFTLKDVSTNKPVSLSNYKTKKVIVVAFIGTECPINNAYMPVLAAMSKAYADKGVQFLAVNSNCNDTPAQIAGHAQKNHLPFPVLRDPANEVADKFGAKRTPEVVVLDSRRVIRYQGRIDDQFGIGGVKRKAPTRRDIVVALDEVLAGKPVSLRSTKVAGCYIERVIPPKANGTITYSRDVSRILQRKCQECHRPGQIGPMPLMTYEDALAWSDTVREVIQQKRMPPWLADPHFGTFANDRSLSPKDRTTVLGWIDQGCPKGNPADMPPPKAFPKEGWSIGKPDAVFQMPQEFDVPATVDERGLKYQYFVVRPKFTEDKWIQAAEARPGNRAIVHHIIVFVVSPGKGTGFMRKHTADGIGDGFLTAYAPGELSSALPLGSAKLIPKNSILIFQMHYTPNGIEQTDRSSVGLIFAKKPPKIEVRTRSAVQHRLAIPPGDSDYEATSSTVFERDAELLSLLPHMHLRGKDFRYDVVFPDGKRQTLLSVPRYDFNWQSAYRLAKPLHMPAGTRIECTAHYDNSSDNPNNPDPKKLVHWGDQTWDEMMIGFVDYAYSK